MNGFCVWACDGNALVSPHAQPVVVAQQVSSRSNNKAQNYTRRDMAISEIAQSLEVQTNLKKTSVFSVEKRRNGSKTTVTM